LPDKEGITTSDSSTGRIDIFSFMHELFYIMFIVQLPFISKYSVGPAFFKTEGTVEAFRRAKSGDKDNHFCSFRAHAACW
jgi:hypothetical protein